MLAKRWLISTFLISLFIFLVVTLPAALLVGSLPPVLLGGQPLQLSAVQGSVWNGQTSWAWNRLSGTLSWQLDWREGYPGVAFRALGAVSFSGWAVASTDMLMVRELDLSLSAPMLRQFQPDLKLGGTISARGVSFTFRDKRITDASGGLAYTGGDAQWRRDNAVVVPALRGVIQQQSLGPEVVIEDDANTVMAKARIDNNIGALTVYRAWAVRLGLSQGGSADDVVFETSLPLWSE